MDKTSKIKKMLSFELKEAKPSWKEIEKLEEETEEIICRLEKAIEKNKINADVFLGGSLAKKTIIQKERYDIDIFVRFDKKYEDDKISDLLSGILKKAKLKAERIHGSRDYFRLKKRDLFEIIPVLKIKKPEEAKNVTDLSYFHVSYVLNKIKKNRKLAGEIILAKSFCYAQRCYGAESYIKGFSGYALELLVSYYRNFLSFIKKMAGTKGQIVLDPGKYYKNKQEILLNLNEAKLQSPIVFVDPTFKQRNTLAALSSDTFLRFRESCSKFLKNPGKRFFQPVKINQKKFNLILEAKTNKQEGDIAGSKLLKFMNFLAKNIEKYFLIRKSDFEYTGKKARYYFKLKKRKEIVYQGPSINKIENLLAFKNKHKDVFIKRGKAYAREKVKINIKQLINNTDKQVRKDMGITKIRIVKS